MRKLEAISRWNKELPGKSAFFLLLMICLGLSALRWLDLGTFWGDGPLWLFQTARAYGGDLPYRDFAFSYPPFSIWLFQLEFYFSGQTFVAAQILVDVLSAAIVFLVFILSTRLMPQLLALIAGFLVACMGDSGFQLFTLQTASPAYLTGAIGLLMAMIGLVDVAEFGRFNWKNCLLATVGCTVAFLSKQEFMVGALACAIAGAVLAATEYNKSITVRIKRAFTIAVGPLLGCLVACALIVLVGMIVGARALLTGLSGYGLAALSCPWWPTGLGLFGALASLGEASSFLALLTLFRFQKFSQKYGRLYLLALATAVAGSVLYFAYIINYVFLSQASQGHLQTIGAIGKRFGIDQGAVLQVISYLFTKPNVFLPVMWVNIALSIILFFAKLLGRARYKTINSIYLVMLITCALSIRQLFGDYTEAYTTVTAAAYPFLEILLVLFLYHALVWILGVGTEKGDRVLDISIVAVIIAVAFYSAVRLAILTTLEFGAGYQRFQTLAGPVNLNDPASVAVYNFVFSHSRAGEPLVDIGGISSYGSGVSFALRRSSPLISVIFQDIEPSDALLNGDLLRFEAAAPKIVLGTFPLHAEYGQSNAWNRCPFPNFVWAPHEPDFDNSKHIPVVEFVRANYAKIFQAGRWAVFAPRE